LEMVLTTFPGSGAEVEEPDWELMIPDQTRGEPESNASWRERAHREWLRITMALRDAGTLAPENRHQIQRLVVAYVRYDRAVAKSFDMGPVIPSPKTNRP
jgi:hypothetical protein